MKRPNKEEMKPASTKDPLDCAIWYSQYSRELEKYADYLEDQVKNSRLNVVVGSCLKCGMMKHPVLGATCADTDCKGQE